MTRAPDRANRARRRVLRTRRGAVIALVAVVAAGVTGWVAGTTIQSPSEAAARIAAPEPSAILAPVERRILSTDVVTRGTGRFGTSQTITLAASVFKDGSRVVTSLPRLGTEVDSGDVVLTISGRPVFLLGGAQPAYRDLGPGIRGDDVLQLETALSALGFNPGMVDRVYDYATAEAVRQFYVAAGFEPVFATEDLLASLRPLAADLVLGARAEPGVQVPADEIAFLPSLPVRVSELPVPVGGEPVNPIMTVTDAAVAIDGSLPVEDARLVVAGMPVRIDEPDLGIEASGVVSRVAETPGTNGLDGFHVYFEITVDDAPSNVVGASVRLTVPIETTAGEVLAVPVSALSLAADGSTSVRKLVNDREISVRVRPGLSAGGFVEVTPIEGSLDAGDMVVIGLEQGSAPGA
ncbi:MAG: peptidoglycan-binding protein [Candidatus Limnocylindria bacterium]